jgi:flagellar M-ring protein FliF
MSPQIEQAKTLVTGMSMFQRISIVLVTLLVGGGIAAVVHFRTEGDFRPLYTGMAAEDAAPVVQKLRESGVEYRLADNGGTVMVPAEKLAESRLTLAGAGLPKSGRIGFELFDKTTFGTTELVEHINYERALEGELERSVMSMSEVVQARVHLSLPKESVFLDQQQPAKASVMVKLRPGARISASQITAVTNLVASAVEGLTTDAVALIDMDGNLLSRPRRVSNDDSQVTSESLEVRQQIEHDLVTKINTTLEPLLGADRFRAGASVDCDLTSGEQQEETFDPDKSVMVSSQKTEDDNQRTAAAGGVPGTAANLPNPPTQNASTNGASRRTESVTYQTSRIVKHTRIPQGVIRRMSLSVLVGQETRWEGDAKNRHRVAVPPTPETLQTIKDLIAGATGFNSDRGDQLIVETLPFETSMNTPDPVRAAPAPVTKPTKQAQWLDLLDKYKGTLLKSFFALILIGVLYRIVMRVLATRAQVASRMEAARAVEAAKVAATVAATVPPPVEDRAEISSNARSLLVEPPDDTAKRVREFAQRDLNATANVLRMWMQDQKG